MRPASSSSHALSYVYGSSATSASGNSVTQSSIGRASPCSGVSSNSGGGSVAMTGGEPTAVASRIMHPIERLRYVARSSGASQVVLVRDTAGALAALGFDPPGLVTAGRRIPHRPPLSAPLPAPSAPGLP